MMTSMNGGMMENFSFHNAWAKVRSKQPVKKKFKVIWHKKNSKRMVVIAFLVESNRLNTRGRLRRFGIVEETGYLLCNDGEETVSHLFFQCEHSWFIWTSLMNKLGFDVMDLGHLEEDAMKILNKFKSKNQIFDVAYAVYTVSIYQIWQERNARVFNDRKIAREIRLQMIEREIQCLVNKNGTKTKRSNANKDFLRKWGVDLLDTS